MRVAAAAGATLLMIGLPNWCLAQSKVCDNPRQMEGFKTCANIEKAEAEGAFTLYSTDPEQGQVKLLASFQVFPKIMTSYVRLQAGALYAKVLSERQASPRRRHPDLRHGHDPRLPETRRLPPVHFAGDGRIQTRVQKPARGVLDVGLHHHGRHRLQPQ